MSKYTFKKTDGGPISTSNAEDWIEKYKREHPDGPWAFFFGEDIVRKVIENPEAEGMRVYLGYDNNKKLQAMLVGARADGTNIWPGGDATAEAKLASADATAADQSLPCPPYCP